jgi:plasmid stabilization system protein ParE
MLWQLYYYDEVSQDIREAKKWYAEQQKGLDKRFTEDVKTSITRLQKNPLNYEVRYKNVRVVYCDIFPYSIHFYMDEAEERLVIIAIVHQHRNPEYSRKRH